MGSVCVCVSLKHGQELMIPTADPAGCATGLGGGIRNSPLGGSSHHAAAVPQRSTAKDRHWEAWEGTK